MSHAKTPPTLPTVVDEAADTPSWVPALGIALFAIVTMFFALRAAWHDAHPADSQPPIAAEAAAPEQAPANE